MDVNRIWILIGKKVTGEASAEDIAELDSLMIGRIDNMYPIRELEEIWLSGKTENRHLSPPQIKERWQRFRNELPENKIVEEEVISLSITQNNSFAGWRWLAVACVLLLMVGMVSRVIWNSDNRDDLITTVIKAPAGSISEVKLPDGTKVWLNAGSKLTYKKHFSKNTREVFLIGEAFFDVVKDARHPFIVTTSSLRLKVIGTAFNVRSFLNDKTSEASLIRGSIEVMLLGSPDKKIVLKPSEKITVRNQQQLNAQDAKAVLSIDQLPLITLNNVHYQEADSLPAEAQWIENRLVFTSEKFEDLANRMERYFEVSIRFEDENVKKLIFSGGFKDESINEAMKALQVTGNFHFKIKDKQIIIY